MPVARASSVSGLRPVARPPVLASECLRDDIAPLEPHANAGRRALFAFGTVALGAGVLSATSHVGASSPIVGGSIAASGLLLLSSATLSGYSARATFSAIAAVVCGGAAVTALSATHSFSSQAWLVSLRALAPVFLATLLLVRATYRAHKPARAMLGPAILAFLCAALFAGGVPVWAPAGSMLPRVAAASMGVVALLALLGFMSEETTGGTQVWSILAVTLGALSLVLDGLAPFTFAWLVPSIALAVSMASLALSLFQLVAARVGPVERAREDVRHSRPPPPALAEEG
ncbi:MAG: hypothetical protein ACXVEF_09590 [Polyangiales bacterium]